MHKDEQEGVIKFRLHFTPSELPPYSFFPGLEAWRQKLIAYGLIGGQDPSRYQGLGFGNVSHRVTPDSPQFLISGTQTGHLGKMDADHYALVSACDPENNSIHATGEWKPSSEAMTHHAIYAAVAQAITVIHVHSPDIWQQAHRLGLPVTDPAIAYGTPAMANEFKRLIQNGKATENTIVMGGHEDGVISWGDTLDAAGGALLAIAERAGIRPREETLS